MDVTLRQYLGLSPNDAIAATRPLIRQTAAIGGQIVLLWHNSSLSDWEEWAAWRDVLTSIRNLANK